MNILYLLAWFIVTFAWAPGFLMSLRSKNKWFVAIVYFWSCFDMVMFFLIAMALVYSGFQVDKFLTAIFGLWNSIVWAGFVVAVVVQGLMVFGLMRYTKTPSSDEVFLTINLAGGIFTGIGGLILLLLSAGISRLWPMLAEVLSK